MGIETETPWISEAVGPNFGARVLHPYKRIIFRNRVVAAGVGMIDIQAHHCGEQVVHTLAGSVGIGAAGAIASCNVEITIGTDDGLAAVMAAGRPFDDDGLRFRTQTRRITARLQLKATSAKRGSVVDLLPLGSKSAEHENVAVFLRTWRWKENAEIPRFISRNRSFLPVGSFGGVSYRFFPECTRPP